MISTATTASNARRTLQVAARSATAATWATRRGRPGGGTVTGVGRPVSGSAAAKARHAPQRARWASSRRSSTPSCSPSARAEMASRHGCTRHGRVGRLGKSSGSRHHWAGVGRGSAAALRQRRRRRRQRRGGRARAPYRAGGVAGVLRARLGRRDRGSRAGDVPARPAGPAELSWRRPGAPMAAVDRQTDVRRPRPSPAATTPAARPPDGRSGYTGQRGRGTLARQRRPVARHRPRPARGLRPHPARRPQLRGGRGRRRVSDRHDPLTRVSRARSDLRAAMVAGEAAG